MRSLRAALLFAAVLAGALATAPAQAATPAPVGQAFYATSAENCGPNTAPIPYGYTAGTLTVKYGSAPVVVVVVVVSVDGVLVDHPILADTSFACRDDGLVSYATYTAYSDNLLVDQQVRKVDNGEVAVSLTLGVNSRPPANRVVIQVCRAAIYPPPVNNCGKAQEYRIPIIGPAA